MFKTYTCRQSIASFSNSFSRSYHTVFFGSDDFSLPTLKALHEQHKAGFLKSLQVVSPADRPQGRYLQVTATPVKQYAQQHSIPVIHPTSLVSLKNFSLLEEFEKQAHLRLPHQFDLGIAVSFRYFIPSVILQEFKLGTINVHPSLLPRYRGAAPLFWTLINGDEEAGVTIQELHPQKMDHGKIIQQVKLPIDPRITYAALLEKASHIGAQEVANLVQLRVENLIEKFKTGIVQEDSKEASLAAKITKQMGCLNFEQDTTLAAYNKWRAFSDTIGFYTFIQIPALKQQVATGTSTVPTETKRLLIKQALHPILDQQLPATTTATTSISDSPLGTMIFENEACWIKCSNGWLACSKLQLEGKKEVTAREFARGVFKIDNKEQKIASVQCVQKQLL